MNKPLDLYHPLILKHQKAPSNFQKMENPDVVIEAYNPICGDQFQIYIRKNVEGLINITFHGYGCAVSKAATSILIERIENQRQKEVIVLLEKYLAMLSSSEDIDGNTDPLHIFRKVREFPGRWECAVLSAESMLDYFKLPTKNR